MKALFFDKKLTFTSIPLPVRREGEALIRVHVAGICNTDIEIIRGYMGFRGVPGHEFVGTVEECGAPELAGKRVVGEINAGCGACDRCRAGDPRHCDDRTVLGILNRNGAFSEYLALPEENLHIVPDSIDNTAAVFTEPLAAALQIFDEHDLPRSREIAVIGDGKLGLLVAQAARIRGYQPVLYGRHAAKLAIAAERGIRTIKIAGALSDRFPIVIECSGSPSGMTAAVNMTEPRGVIVLKSTCAAEPRVDFARVVINEISIVGSRCGRFAPALELLEQNAIDTASMISAVYPLGSGVEAFRAAVMPASVKILITITPE